MRYALGIDIGTQSVKTGLLDLSTFELVGAASRPYPGGAIQSTGEIWQACLDAISETTSYCSDPSAICAVGLSGQMHGVVLCDSQGEAVHPLINWQDERCNLPVEKYGGLTTIERIYELLRGKDLDCLGVDRIASGFLGATLFHIKENDPQLYEKAARALPASDFIRMKLTGGADFATDPTNAFATGLFNTRDGMWSQEVVEALGLQMDILPRIKGTSEIGGRVCDAAARATGLSAGVPVAVGGGDNLMAMLGAGAISPGGPICVNIGTSSQICAVTDSYRKIPGMDTRVCVDKNFAHVYAGLAGGKCYTWLKNVLLADAEAIGAGKIQEDKIYGILDRLAEDIPPGCDGLSFTPALRGTRRNPQSRGSFSGVGENNFTAGHKARAVMEGVVAELLDSYNLMGGKRAGFISGAGNGLVKSSIWRKITANAFGMPLKLSNIEHAVYGAALCAARAAGLTGPQHIEIPYSITVTPE